uniref:Uncharacterized protein n=1 Tax=Physcomitrium patens TaxID=3218 RepID=A0A2K1JS52_PHYPA|nr:hypothetical protein PHYPA_016742 [Physcomitrium patens]
MTLKCSGRSARNLRTISRTISTVHETHGARANNRGSSPILAGLFTSKMS